MESCDERLELRNELGVPAEREIGVNPILERREPELLEAQDLVLGEAVVGEVGERVSSPQGKRVAQELRCTTRVLLELAPAFGDQALEPARVERVAVEPEHVPGCLCEDQVRSGRAEHGAELRDGVLERLVRGRRRTLAPEALDQLVAREHLVRPERENRKKGPLPSSAQLDPAAVHADLERAENANARLSHRTNPPTGLSSSAPPLSITG